MSLNLQRNHPSTMFYFYLTSFLFFLSTVLNAQSERSISGSWEFKGLTEDQLETVHRIQIVDNYLVHTIFDSTVPSFIGTLGGTILRDGDAIELSYEFNTFDTSKVGTVDRNRFKWENESIKDLETQAVFPRTTSKTQALDAAWTITGRMRDGEIQRRTVGARKTMKILSGGYFQWIAFNMESTAFSGSGGGTYTANDGKYVENIEFFSRDSSRVGASLSFEYELIDGEWHHKGLSSRGQPIYEIWSRLNLE